jgi:uncharacterized protein
MRFAEARAYILERLENELAADLFYHGIHHTLDVCKAVDELADAEKVTGEPLTLLRTAALFHDSGFLKQYLNNEPVAVELVHAQLPAFGYSAGQIDTIGSIILSTSIPQRPESHIAQIMCDADLDYLGRDDFFSISRTLMKEWQAYGLVNTEKEYNEKQIRFFTQHSYFTKTAVERREQKKQEHLFRIEQCLGKTQ